MTLVSRVSDASGVGVSGVNGGCVAGAVAGGAGAAPAVFLAEAAFLAGVVFLTGVISADSGAGLGSAVAVARVAFVVFFATVALAAFFAGVAFAAFRGRPVGAEESPSACPAGSAGVVAPAALTGPVGSAPPA